MTHSRNANAIRALSMDAVQKAKSGHPGMPMGMADIATVLWQEFYRHDPKNPECKNRDRFILSNGHGSMLQYALLHLSGYALSIEDIKNFRQLHSPTAGHPEYGYAPGIETSTGPLGQGLANGVGMALAEKMLAQRYNQPDCTLIDNYTYVFCGDGCLMEGVSHEVCSFAGTHHLNKLIVFYDDNQISIDGDVKDWFTDNTQKRFEAYDWNVLRVDGHNPEEIRAAIQKAKSSTDKPTLIICKTIIGFGAPNTVAGHASCHGSPLGDAVIAQTRLNLEWEYAPFEIPADVYAAFDATQKGAQFSAEWEKTWQAYAKKYPQLAKEFTQRYQSPVIPNIYIDLTTAIATREASKKVLDAIAPAIPALVGGSADLTGSNLTHWGTEKSVQEGGRYIYYGVREFGMNAIMNGMRLYGGFIPFGGTFLTFLDYGKNALRMAALMGIQAIYVYTHDSIGLGEDGPTHQPIEQLATLRATPNVQTWRPADTLETQVAWTQSLQHQTGPSVLCLTRQKLPSQGPRSVADIAQGGYVLKEGKHPLTFIATGSEVALAMELANELDARVVSMPCMERFRKLPISTQNAILGSKRVIIEAASSQPWHEFAGNNGLIISLDQYGLSAPADKLFAHFGFTKNAILEKIHATIRV